MTDPHGPTGPSTPPPLRAVVFDIGNVLLRFNYRVAAERLALLNGLDSLPEEAPIAEAKALLESGAITRSEFLARVMPLFGHAGSEESFLEIWRDIFHPNTPMLELAADLSARMPVFLLSNISCIHREHIFQRYPEFHIFKKGAFSYELGCLKPSPEIYRKALQLFGFAPAEVILFDDMPENVHSARAEGWHALHYNFRRHHEFLESLARLGLTPSRTTH